MNPFNQDLYGNYRNRKFTDIWGDYESFFEDYTSSKLDNMSSEFPDNITTLYYLLYARYGNSTIASSDENQFKYKVFTLIFMYGPTWAKRLELQKQIRGLSIEELRLGATAIHNHAYNPSTAPSTQSLDELTYINDQNVQKYKKSLGEAYGVLIQLLETDVTAYFLDRFKNLFLTVVEPELPLWYVTDLDELQEEPTPTPEPQPEPEPEPITEYEISPNFTVTNVVVPTQGTLTQGATPTKIFFVNTGAGTYKITLTGSPLAMRSYYTITLKGKEPFTLEPSTGYTHTFTYAGEEYFEIVSNALDYSSRVVNLKLE